MSELCLFRPLDPCHLLVLFQISLDSGLECYSELDMMRRNTRRCRMGFNDSYYYLQLFQGSIVKLPPRMGEGRCMKVRKSLIHHSKSDVVEKTKYE